MTGADRAKHTRLPATIERMAKVRSKRDLGTAYGLLILGFVVGAHRHYLAATRSAHVNALAHPVFSLLAFGPILAGASGSPLFVLFVVALWIWDACTLPKRVRDYNELVEAEAAVTALA